MKMALLDWEMPSKPLGGTAVVTYNIARILARNGDEVLVITTRSDAAPGESDMEGFRVHRVRIFRIKALKYAFFCLKVVLVLRKFRPDVVHAQALWTGLPAFMAKKVTGRPYLVNTHGGDIYYPRQFKGLLSKIVLRNADTAVAETEDMKKEMQKVCDRDVLVIGNGVNPEEFRRYTREEARRQFGIGDSDKVILFVGTLGPVKGVKYLIDAMPVIKREHPAARLLIVGDGMDRDDLEAQTNRLNMEKDITFYGRTNNAVRDECLAASDLFVLPSLSEGFPNVIAEAMAAGLPIVTTRVRGLPEIVADGKNGFLVEPANSSQLAEKVSFILNSDSLRVEMSGNNRAWAEANSWDKIVERFKEVYSKML